MTSMTGSRGPTGGNTRSTTTPKFSGDKIPQGYKAGQIQQYTPEQLELYQQLFGHLGPDSYLSRLAGGDQSLFEEMEAPALRQFSGIQGNIASRFSQGGGGPGAMSSRRSSGFQNKMNQAGSDFAQDLQSKRQGLMRQAMIDLHSMSSDLLDKRPYERFLYERPKNFWEKLGGGALRAGGTAAGAYFGGPGGAAAGYQGGNALAESFGF